MPAAPTETTSLITVTTSCRTSTCVFASPNVSGAVHVIGLLLVEESVPYSVMFSQFRTTLVPLTPLTEAVNSTCSPGLTAFLVTRDCYIKITCFIYVPYIFGGF